MPAAPVIELSHLSSSAAGKPEHPRSPHWPRVRAEHLLHEPACMACGGTAALEVHHVRPVSWPGGAALELEPSNLITLCESLGHNCHLIWGHLGDWKSRNEQVRADAAAMLQKISNRPYPPAAT